MAHLAVQVCIVGNHPGDHLPRQRVFREPARVGHGKDGVKYVVQVDHGDNNDGDTEGAAFERNLMVEKSSKTGGVSFTSSTVRRI